MRTRAGRFHRSPAETGERAVYRKARRGRARPARAAACAAVLLGLGACVTTPVTGRQAFNLVSIEQDRELGNQAYGDFLSQAQVNDAHPQAAMVQRVVDRLVPVAQADLPIAFDWEVHVIQDDQTANAWCLPGGKMAVYTGILPLTQDEAGLAVVMAHEIGHAVARHGTERMSQQQGVDTVLAYAGGEYGLQDYAAYAGAALNLMVFLPWGRKQELEADHIGLIYMARAGYDPRAAVGFWTRMAAASGGGAPPEFLSTHPSDDTRVSQIEELLPGALAEYEAATGAAPAKTGNPK